MIGDQEISIVDDGIAPPNDLAIGPRIGIREGKDLPWRLWVKENLYVSLSLSRR